MSVCIFALLQAYRDKEADFGAKQAEYAAVTAERDEVRQVLPDSGLPTNLHTAMLRSSCLSFFVRVHVRLQHFSNRCLSQAALRVVGLVLPL